MRETTRVSRNAATMRKRGGMMTLMERSWSSSLLTKWFEC